MQQSLASTTTTPESAEDDGPPGPRRALRHRSTDQALQLEAPAQFEAIVDSHLARSRRQGAPLVVLRLTVDSVQGPGGYAAGHEVEQRVLAECAHRLCSRVRSVDQVVRIGGRGFGVVLVGANEAAGRAVSLRLALAGGGLYRLGNQLLDLRLRVGHAAFPEAGAGGAALVRAATF
ncbi:diguanylate cyclase [Aquincola sp. S2]|uniref:Diguanylate cyclase n=1 Tax=Pseudaquabacterium terrae TaxID=2732868 RepID=A0ABX2EMQ2_9BURK|nr:diguanylate cyclase [Aquabacterium terrae]NRF69774.1 diguanylate cyclase [Aquabacterium terrae]